MSEAAAVSIPSLEETGHSAESLIEALRNERDLPSAELAFATVQVDAIAPDVIAVLERAQREDLDAASGRLLFRGLHILGGRRFTAAYRPLLALLQGPQDRVEALLGDAVTEDLSKILAGLFDGDAQPLYQLVADARIDPYVRDAGLGALAFLTFDGRIDRAAFEAFLLHFDDARLGAGEDVVWHRWMTAVAVLGITALEERVRAAFADGRITPDWCDEDDFEKLLKAAIERPDDRTRLADESLGYLDDVLVALEKYSGSEDDDDVDVNDDDLGSLWPEFTAPARNPYRDVGRNDPCPCGSGRKFKKCCLSP